MMLLVLTILLHLPSVYSSASPGSGSAVRKVGPFLSNLNCLAQAEVMSSATLAKLDVSLRCCNQAKPDGEQSDNQHPGPI